MSAAAEARSALRALLRAVDRSITPASGNRQWRDYVLAEARRAAAAAATPQPQELGCCEEAQADVADARDYALLLNAVREHKELLLSYNIGIPIDEREANMNKRAAGMVGLQMPKPYELHELEPVGASGAANGGGSSSSDEGEAAGSR